MKTMKLKGKSYRIIKEFNDSFLVISEIGFIFKTIPKLVRIK